jgi:hypothetical protein
VSQANLRLPPNKSISPPSPRNRLREMHCMSLKRHSCCLLPGTQVRAFLRRMASSSRRRLFTQHSMSLCVIVAFGFNIRSAQSHLSSFRTSSCAGCVLGFWCFPLYELHPYSSIGSKALHWEQGRSSKRVWRSHRITCLFIYSRLLFPIAFTSCPIDGTTVRYYLRCKDSRKVVDVSLVDRL